MPDWGAFVVLAIFVGALLLVALGKVLWDRRPKKNARLAPPPPLSHFPVKTKPRRAQACFPYGLLEPRQRKAPPERG